MIQIIEQYGIYIYAVVILFGGIWGTTYIPFNWQKKYKFGAFASIFAIIFILLEVFVSETFVKEDVIKYLLTYTVVTSCYELFLRELFIKIGIMKNDQS